MRTGFRSYVQKRKKPQSSNYGWYAAKDTIMGNERYPIDILSFSHDAKKYHPTQKPTQLVEYLIMTYTDKGDVVLDNCMGSGTTAVAALKTGRHFIGYEINKNYCSIAEQRIIDIKSQPTLF